MAAVMGALTVPAAAAERTMTLTVMGARDNARDPSPMVFCAPAAKGHVRLGTDRSPAMKWTTPPRGTRSLAILMFDDDVPADTRDVNKEGRSIPAEAARRRFYHWTLVDLPAELRSIGAGGGGSGVVPHGRAHRRGPGRSGINDYTGLFKNDPAMVGTYAGYDGPCPPWNDERVHHYVVRVLALDVRRLPLADDFTGAQFEQAVRGHVLGSGSVTLTYTTQQPAPR